MKIRSGGKRSAIPVAALSSVPQMKPIWVAAMSHPNCPGVAPSQAESPSTAPLGLNHSEVPNHCAKTMDSTAAPVTRLDRDCETAIVSPHRHPNRWPITGPSCHEPRSGTTP